MAKIRHRLVEVGNKLQVLNKHQVVKEEKVTFSFKLKGGKGEHKLAVHGENSDEGPAFLKLVDPSTSWEVTVAYDDPEPQQIHAKMKPKLEPGDYVYEIEELVGGKWEKVLDPILEIEGGFPPPQIAKVVAALGVGLLAGVLAHKALK